MRFTCSVALSALSVVALFVPAVSTQSSPQNAPPAAAPASSALDRYLTTVGDPAPSYRCKRVLTARAGSRQATLVAMTSLDSSGQFKYDVISEEGSGIIRSKVLHAALDTEQKAKSRDQAARAAVTPANYTFEPAGASGEGAERVRIKPRRNEPMMIDGSIVLDADDGDLMKIEGTLVKRPSFWTRRVEIAREYARIGGARVPVSMSSVADVLFVGRSTFDMRYEYESINGVPVRPTASADAKD
jgi:hypothetical protein